MSPLKISDLVYRWRRQATPCLDIPRFAVAQGERIFLHGPSGSGKSTLLPGVALDELWQAIGMVERTLLAPYFGACIHSPPPPANQIVHATSAKPLKNMRSMDAVWVSGTLSLHRADTPWGKAGYRLAVDKVSPYEETKKK